MGKPMSDKEYFAHQVASATKKAEHVNSDIADSVKNGYGRRNDLVVAINKKGKHIIESYKIAESKGFEILKFATKDDVIFDGSTRNGKKIKNGKIIP